MLAAMDQEQKDRAERKLFRKLEERQRLRDLAAEVTYHSPFDKALARLKGEYLPIWSTFAMGSAEGKSFPGQSPMVDFMRPVANWEKDAGTEPDPNVCNAVEWALNEITAEVPMARAALAVRYMNARGPSVYRSGRLTALSEPEIEDLADVAERKLVPLVGRKLPALYM